MTTQCHLRMAFAVWVKEGLTANGMKTCKAHCAVDQYFKFNSNFHPKWNFVGFHTLCKKKKNASILLLSISLYQWARLRTDILRWNMDIYKWLESIIQMHVCMLVTVSVCELLKCFSQCVCCHSEQEPGRWAVSPLTQGQQSGGRVEWTSAVLNMSIYLPITIKTYFCKPDDWNCITADIRNSWFIY